MQSSITLVPGFRAVGLACGIKPSGNPDLALIVADQLCNAAAVFTKNAFQAAPVIYDIDLLKRNQGTLQAIVVNAGVANAMTGEQGMQDAETMARLTETACQLPLDSAFVMSTGSISHLLPMDKIEPGIQQASELIQTDAGAVGQNVAEAILTTDLVKKEASVQATIAGQTVTVGGIAKGSGMIHPNMATMLSAVVTDAKITPSILQCALQKVVDVTFNRITVDGDTSTNDTVVVMASGKADMPTIEAETSAEFEAFCQALTDVCRELAKAVARDGEGATKLMEITVQGAVSEADAELAAKAIGTSPLLKTAMFGNDPNYGRALAAIGYSGAEVDPAKVSFWLDHIQLVEQGEPQDFDVEAATKWLESNKEIKLIADLGLGDGSATVWSCDFSYKYVEINAEYHT